MLWARHIKKSRRRPAGLPATVMEWPAWNNKHYTIRLSQDLVEIVTRDFPEDPAAIITKAHRNGTSHHPNVCEQLEWSFIQFIYGSNRIETVGTSMCITIKLCRAVSHGVAVDAEIDDDSPEYEEHIPALVQSHRKGDMAGVIRSRKEVVQHAKALAYLVDQVILEDEPISEQLILDTHGFLCKNIDDETPVGEYRDYEVAVAYSKPGEKKKRAAQCMRAKAVPAYMANLVEHLNKEIAEAEDEAGGGGLDPCALAARFHHHFVMIRPFGDDNGRMTRLIMNVLFLKYTGYLSLFGHEDGDKEEYLAIVGRGRKIFDEEDMEVEFSRQASHLEFARYVLRKSELGLFQMWERESLG
ncbi:fido domain-containing protein [Bombardia bombarda]|uniref:Fido domain-containing protein n=1 Tax=Bombardia bombarda TaxID=252184 RepID=A0AA39XIR2_9PEZI|nr:fido domain-containing protein [Bombardia bombarda]